MLRNFELTQQLEKERETGKSVYGAAESLPRVRKNQANSASLWNTGQALRLVQQLFLSQAEGSPRLVVFAGVDDGSGCSTISYSVAETIAKNVQRPVCFVDANLRSSEQSNPYGTNSEQGLSDALASPGSIMSFVTPSVQENLWVLPAGRFHKDSVSLVTSNTIPSALAELKKEFDYVLLDAPPLTFYADSIVLGQMSDGLVLVVDAGTTRREAASVVMGSLRSANVTVLAAVLNKRKFPIPSQIYRKL
jgi:succinoglycan biosynthesis transport protein ExoP